MRKNILVLTGSPRASGNSDLLADAFIKGATSAGHEVQKFETAFRNIKGCLACDRCWSTGTPCFVRDDFSELEPLLEKADILVLAFPLYWFSFPAQIKAPIDRLYSYVKPQAKVKLKIKKAAMLITAGDDDIKCLDGVKKSFELICDYIKWKNAGTLEAINTYEKDAVKKTDFLKKAEEFGKNIA